MTIKSTSDLLPILLCIDNVVQVEVIKPMSSTLFEVHFNSIAHVFHYDLFICF